MAPTPMNRLTIEVEEEGDGRWIAEVPELSGTLAYGASRAEAIARVQAVALRVLADRLDHGEAVSELARLFVDGRTIRAECSADIPPVQSRADLIEHLFRLLADYDAIGDRWENKDISSFLEAMAAWLNDCEGYYRNTGQPIDARAPSWRLFADALSAASVYE